MLLVSEINLSYTRTLHNIRQESNHENERMDTNSNELKARKLSEKSNGDEQEGLVYV